MDWHGWLEHFSIQLPKTVKQSHYTDYSIVLQAALESQGLALGWRHIIAPLLAQGRLVEALKDEIVTGNPFHIIAPSQLPLSPAAACTRDWLIEQVAN
jgi:LysR family glycine cleavage system transcriptional activator